MKQKAVDLIGQRAPAPYRYLGAKNYVMVEPDDQRPGSNAMHRWLLPILLVCVLAGGAAAAEQPGTPVPVSTPDRGLELEALQPVLPLRSATTTAQGRLVVQVRKLRSSLGNVWVGLFSGPAGFPDFRRARRVSVAHLTANSAEAVFTDLPYGAYAIAVYHDEDRNLKLTRNWLGMVREGTGASNNPAKTNYSNARFELDAAELRLLINLDYPAGGNTGSE